ncbi:MAG TPA: SDR family oxidoreductase [Vicinamibacterales bacterium]|nr:SDR family oxidoreductase [Vicinamibacterales bacterium]
MSFRKRVVVVTGGTAGIGRATVQAFARAGASVAILARDPGRLDATAREVRELGGRALALEVDVADSGAVESAAARIETELGPIDIWVNNAMASVFAPVTELSAGEIRRVTEVTYLGAVHGTQAALRRMVARNRGTIVQIGSTLAFRAIPLQAPYCAAKHAIKAFSESLRIELRHARSRVRITQVHLPAVNTPQFDWTRSKLAGRPRPLPPIFQPEIAARAILYAAHYAPRGLKVGMPVSLIWLNTLLPGASDRHLARAAYTRQQERAGADRPRADNLYRPVDWNVGAHGRFDDEAAERSRALDVRLSARSWATTAVAAASVIGAAVILKRLGDAVAP